jgi:hypothetical protein
MSGSSIEIREIAGALEQVVEVVEGLQVIEATSP